MAYDVTLMQQTYGLPVELATQLQALQETNFADNFGESFSRLSLKGFAFSLVSGSSVTQLGNGPLNVVFLGDDPRGNYLTYYAGAYSATAEDIKPDAVWYANDPAPVTVPPSVLEKDPRTGKFGYSRKQRTVIAVLDNSGAITPVVFDINASSMFGDNYNIGQAQALSYSNYRRALAKLGVLPCCIQTQIVFDRTAGIPAVKFVPVMDANGRPQLLPNDILQKVISVATSKEVSDLLKVHTIPDNTTDVTQSAPVQPAPVQPTPVQPTPVEPAIPTGADALLAEANSLMNQAAAVDLYKGPTLDMADSLMNQATTVDPVQPAPQVAASPLSDLVSGVTQTAPAEPVMATSADLAALLTAAKS